MKGTNKSYHENSQKMHQHFIEGIGDGKLNSSYDLPDHDVRKNLRKRFHDRHEAAKLKDHQHDVPILISDEDIKNQIHSKIGPDTGRQEEEIKSSFETDVSLMTIVFILGLFMAFTSISNIFISRNRRRLKSKLKRTESLLVRQKKKTDEWCNDGDHADYESDIPVREPSPIYFDMFETNNLHNRKRSGSESRARLRKIGTKTKTEKILPHQHIFHDGGHVHGHGGLDGFDLSEPSIESACSDVDDEEMPTPTRKSVDVTNAVLNTDETDVETPTKQTKQPIYVDSFAQLTMPNISKTVSDGDAFSDSNDDEPSSKANPESGGQTEGANGILHKRKDLTACSDAASSLHSPITFSELKLDTLIGGGGFGQVWKASWRGTPVAVKLLSASSQAYNVQKAILQEFAAEINMLSGMRHPNICLYIGACLEPTNRAIVTELAANGSLWDALRLPLKAPYTAIDGVSPEWPIELYDDVDVESRSVIKPPAGTWPWVLVRKVAEGAARGINYLHCGNPSILHRDLKSANILLDDSYNPKVCDFGLSRIKAHENDMTGNCGTIQWMAPEILASEAYAEPADVYSYGIILWELLTGECPFEGLSSIQCAMSVLNHGLVPIVPDWCPSMFADLVHQCVNKDPAKRPTFEAILSTLGSMPK